MSKRKERNDKQKEKLLLANNAFLNLINAWSPIITALSTLAYVFFAGWQLIEIHNATKIAKIQSQITSEELHRAHRPWIGISSPIQIVKPLSIDSDGSHITICFTYKNGGNSPALNATSIVGLFVGVEPPTTVARNILAQDKGVAESVSKEFGVLVLPGDTHTITTTIDSPPPKSLEQLGFAVLSINIGYQDEFGQFHSTHLFWSYEPENGERRFILNGSINGSLKTMGTSHAY